MPHWSFVPAARLVIAFVFAPIWALGLILQSRHGDQAFWPGNDHFNWAMVFALAGFYAMQRSDICRHLGADLRTAALVVFDLAEVSGVLLPAVSLSLDYLLIAADRYWAMKLFWLALILPVLIVGLLRPYIAGSSRRLS